MTNKISTKRINEIIEEIFEEHPLGSNGGSRLEFEKRRIRFVVKRVLEELQ